MATTRKRNVEIEFLVDDKRATKSLRNIEGQVTKTGKSFALAGKLIASGLVLDKVKDFAQESVRAYSDLNESMNAIDKTFGGAAQGIKLLGENAAESLGLSNAEFNSLAVQFSAFAETIAGEGNSVVPVMDDLTTRMADFASVMNLDVTEAARLFQSGLAGETEPLRKYGIDVSAAAVNQQALAMGLGDSSNKLSEQDKILARYRLLMAQTDKTAGDFADTSDELANQQRILSAETENAKAAFGEGLAPVMEGTQKTANDLMTVLGNLGQAFGGAGEETTFWGDALNVLTAGGTLNVAVDQLSKLADRLRDNEDAQRELAEAQLESLKPTEAQIKAAEGADKVFRLQAEAMDDLASSTDDAVTAQQELTDIQKAAADPAFKLLRAIEKYGDAQDDYTEAITEFGDSSDQAAEAAQDLADAQLDLNEAGADFAAQGGAASIEAIVDLLEKAGVLPETIQAIIDKINEYNDTPITRKEVFVPGVGNVIPGAGGTIGGPGTMIGFAEGGMVPGPKGAPMPALVHGGEMILNPDQQAALKTGGPATVINYTALSLSDRQLKEHQEMVRRS